MTSLYIICFVLLSAGIILLLGLTPENVTDDIMRLFASEQTLRDKVLIAKNEKKSRRITKMLLHTRDALTAVGKSGQFTLTCEASLVLLIAGSIVAVMVDNIFMIPVFALAFAAIPFLFARNTIKAYDKHIREEMETAMSCHDLVHQNRGYCRLGQGKSRVSETSDQRDFRGFCRRRDDDFIRH